jgi:nitrite reductase (NADH) large subunit
VHLTLGTLERTSAGAQTSAPAAVTAGTIVIIGNGMVGHRLCRRLAEDGTTSRVRVVVFGEEREPAYDRVHLTDAFSGRHESELCLAPPAWYAAHGIALRLDEPVVAIDRETRCVSTAAGDVLSYTRLVLATGSTPHVPPIEGRTLSRVFVYRTLQDLRAIRAAAATARTAAVIGGGLLGLEAARALQRQGLRVTVIESAAGLMPAQLDADTGRELARQVADAGLEILTGTMTRRIADEDGRRVLHFTGGDSRVADLVVIATGVRPRTELAARCGLALTPEGAVAVDDALRTSDPTIHAIGECAAHRGQMYGLVAPGYEMADALALMLAGDTVTFRGAVPAVKLKMMGVSVVSAGEPLNDGSGTRFHANGVARIIKLRDGRIVGALGVGTWPDFGQVQEAVARGRRVWPWQRVRFAASGRLWPERDDLPVTSWEPQAVVCHCLGVTRGQIGAACAPGPANVETIVSRTGASTLCGSCRPLLEQLAMTGAWAPGRIAIGLLSVSVAAIVLGAVIVAMPPVPFAPSFAPAFRVDELWRNTWYRQVTGFTLIGFTVLAALLTVRKRWKHVAALGSFSAWRMVHLVLGLVTLMTLAVHTGGRLGDNLNLALMTSFSMVNVVGAVAGGVTALESRAGTRRWRRMRATLVAAHVMAMWPLPLLLIFHVLSVYYF